MEGQHGCSQEYGGLCQSCERFVCALHAVNTYGSFMYCIRCYTHGVAEGAVVKHFWDA